jgi:predicted restriction endonuclease
MMSINTYMFWHWTASLRVFSNTRDHKSNTPVQVLITLTVIIKVLKYSNCRTIKFTSINPLCGENQNYMIVSLFKYKLRSVSILSEACEV